MADITTIILTKNEELHIRRCLENVAPISQKVLVIDCQSTDRTCEICNEFANVEVVQHPWPGNQATQFNWAIDNLDINTEWILRIDADEYLLPELARELQEKMEQIPAEVTGIEFKRRHIFLGKWMKHGIYPVILLRMFRKGCGRYETRLMDEHIKLLHGKTMMMEHDFCDHNLNNLSYFCKKHVDYATREAAELLNIEYVLTECTDTDNLLSKQAKTKREQKIRYSRCPLFWRSFAYFLYRYFLRGAFLDGKEGFLWTFIQGWWYRTLVDAKIFEIKKACGNDKEKIREYLKREYGISL